MNFFQIESIENTKPHSRLIDNDRCESITWIIGLTFMISSMRVFLTPLDQEQGSSSMSAMLYIMGSVSCCLGCIYYRLCLFLKTLVSISCGSLVVGLSICLVSSSFSFGGLYLLGQYLLGAGAGCAMLMLRLSIHGDIEMSAASKSVAFLAMSGTQFLCLSLSSGLAAVAVGASLLLSAHLEDTPYYLSSRSVYCVLLLVCVMLPIGYLLTSWCRKGISTSSSSSTKETADQPYMPLPLSTNTDLTDRSRLLASPAGVCKGAYWYGSSDAGVRGRDEGEAEAEADDNDDEDEEKERKKEEEEGNDHYRQQRDRNYSDAPAKVHERDRSPWLDTVLGVLSVLVVVRVAGVAVEVVIAGISPSYCGVSSPGTRTLLFLSESVLASLTLLAAAVLLQVFYEQDWMSRLVTVGVSSAAAGCLGFAVCGLGLKMFSEPLVAGSGAGTDASSATHALCVGMYASASVVYSLATPALHCSLVLVWVSGASHVASAATGSPELSVWLVGVNWWEIAREAICRLVAFVYHQACRSTAVDVALILLLALFFTGLTLFLVANPLLFRRQSMYY